LFLADKYIVHSENNKEILCKSFGISEKKVKIVPHGIVIPKTIKGITKEEARTSFGINKDSKVVLFFGNIREYKGLDTLIKAFNELEIKDKKLMIAGKCWENKSKYESLLNKNIQFNDQFIPDDEIEKYFVASDIVVLPYRHFESASGVGGLALPFHRPIIVSNVGSLPDLVKDKCCIFQPDNTSELKEKMQSILTNKKKYEKLVDDSRQKEKEFSYEQIVKKTIEAYEE